MDTDRWTLKLWNISNVLAQSCFFFSVGINKTTAQVTSEVLHPTMNSGNPTNSPLYIIEMGVEVVEWGGGWGGGEWGRNNYE